MTQVQVPGPLPPIRPKSPVSRFRRSGLSATGAAAALHAAGFVVFVEHSVTGDFNRFNTVVFQEPANGSPAAKGSPVRIVIGHSYGGCAAVGYCKFF